jgi:hypothetical protein
VSAEDNITATIREDVLQVLFDDIATLHNNLTSSEYDILPGSVLSTFPKVCTKGNAVSSTDVKKLLHKRIWEEFRNNRKRKCRDRPAAQKRLILYL